MGYRIEAVDPADERAQATLHAFLLEMAERVDARYLEAEASAAASAPDFFVLALDDADRPVGCAALREAAPGVGQLGQLWVNPVLRGRGVARRMLSALEGAAAVAALDVVRLEAAPTLQEAILLFETNGYQRVDDGGSEDAPVVYEKQLA